MPVQSCTKNGQKGYKWGDSGACYIGPGAKQKALKQGAAIEISKHKKGEASEFDPEFTSQMTDHDFQLFMDAAGLSLGEQVQLSLARNSV